MSSPIDGRIGVAQVKVGNLVGPAAGGRRRRLHRAGHVRQLDPMGVDIQVTSRYLDRVTRLIAQGLPVEVFRPGLEGEEARRFPGKATVIDNTIDPTTSTFLVQAEVANPEKTLLPGEYVKADVKVGEVRGRGRRPRAGRGRDPGRPDRLHRRRAGQGGRRPGPGDLTYEGLRVLESGLEPGQSVIVEGLQLVRPGMTVKTEPAPPDALRRDRAGPGRQRSTDEAAQEPAEAAATRTGDGPAAAARASPTDADPSATRMREQPWSTSSSAGRSSPRCWPC